MSQKEFLPTDCFHEIIKEVFPKACKIKKIQHAWTNFVFEVENEGQQFVFRFPRNEFFANALEKEIQISNFVFGKTTIATNKLVRMQKDGKTFSVHKKIQGECLTNVYSSLSKAQINALALDVCTFLKQLQALETNKLESLTNFLSGLSKVNTYDKYDFNKLELLKRLENEKSCFCHGDLNPGNIIMQNGKVVGIIDFAFACKSNPLVDLSRIVGRLPKNFEQAFKQSFESVFETKISCQNLEKMIELWSYVEQNYIGYVEKECLDIVLPKFFN